MYLYVTKKQMTKEKELGDSVIAQELYYSLQKEGFKVFFAKITLENKIGESYEPYIYAALNSAKVMLVIGSKKEYFEAPWVKNEWSRFQALIKNGDEKTIIPCYKEMDPYDLPEEFAYLQAQDISKIGFEQDLIYGIKKLVKKEPKKKQNKTPIIIISIIAIILITVVSIFMINAQKTNEGTNTAKQIIRQDVLSASGYTFNVKTEDLKNKIMKIVTDGNLQEQTVIDPETGEPMINEITGEEYKYGMKEKKLYPYESSIECVAIGWFTNVNDLPEGSTDIEWSAEDYEDRETDVTGIRIYSSNGYVTGISCVPPRYGSGEVELITIPINLYNEAKKILGEETSNWKELVDSGIISEKTYDRSNYEEITDGSFFAGMIMELSI